MNNDSNNNFQNPTTVNEPAGTTGQDGYVYRWDASQPTEAQPKSKKLGGIAIFGIVLAAAYAAAAIVLAVVLVAS